MKYINTTLLLVIQNGRILLAEKKRGFGVGRINGAGGKQEPGETVEQTMIRETQEEFGITPTNFKKRAIFDFDEYYKDVKTYEKMHIYVAEDFEGVPTESDEMRPVWFDLDKVPFERMFPDDRLWMPLILKGHNLTGFFKFDKDFNMLEHEIKIFEGELD